MIVPARGRRGENVATQGPRAVAVAYLQMAHDYVHRDHTMKQCAGTDHLPGECRCCSRNIARLGSIRLANRWARYAQIYSPLP